MIFLLNFYDIWRLPPWVLMLVPPDTRLLQICAEETLLRYVCAYQINSRAHWEPSYQICTYCYAPAWILGLNSGWAFGLVVACLFLFASYTTMSKCILWRICIAGLLGKLCMNAKFLKTRNCVCVVVWTNGGSWSERGFLGQVMRKQASQPLQLSAVNTSKEEQFTCMAWANKQSVSSVFCLCVSVWQADDWYSLMVWVAPEVVAVCS